MAFEYVGLDPCLKLVSAAFENPFGLEHLETAQQKRDQSKGGGPIRVDECLSRTSVARYSSPLTSCLLSALSFTPLFDSMPAAPLSSRTVKLTAAGCRPSGRHL